MKNRHFRTRVPRNKSKLTQAFESLDPVLQHIVENFPASVAMAAIKESNTPVEVIRVIEQETALQLLIQERKDLAYIAAAEAALS